MAHKNFRAGDQVIVVASYSSHLKCPEVGDIGTIILADDNGVDVQFDNFFSGHAGRKTNARGISPHCWCFWSMSTKCLQRYRPDPLDNTRLTE